MKKRGFTLTEMIAAIVILAIIIALGIVTFNGIRNSILEKDYEKTFIVFYRDGAPIENGEAALLAVNVSYGYSVEDLTEIYTY